MNILRTYLDTNFIFYDNNTSYIIKINEPTPFLNKKFKSLTQKSWAFVTAWNPRSKELPLEENNKRHQSLVSDLNGFTVLKGKGESIDKQYFEESLLIIGITKEDAIKLGEKYQQNAIVFGEKGKVAELVLLSSFYKYFQKNDFEELFNK